MWAIWHTRRKAIREDSFQSPLSTHYFIERYLAYLEMSKPRKGSEEESGGGQALNSTIGERLEDQC